jgi:hypothetical protein
MFVPHRLKNTFGYYPAGRKPGFDPTHVAAGSLFNFSVVALRGDASSTSAQDVFCIVPGGPCNNTGSTGTLTSGIDSILGISITGFDNSGTGPVIRTPSASNWVTTPNSVTVAAIVGTGTNGGVPEWLFSSSEFGLQGVQLGRLANNNLALASNGNVDSGLTLTVGRYYFIAASAKTSGTWNFCTFDLMGFNNFSGSQGGAILTSGVAGNALVADGPNYNIGNSNANSATRAWTDGFHCVMYSGGTYLSQLQLRQWASDLWSFWYPPTLENALALSQVKSPAASVLTPGGIGGHFARRMNVVEY